MRTQTFTLDLGAGERLVGDHLPGAAPGYLYLHGLGSVRAGEKSSSLFAHAASSGRACTRFDFRGHGASSGRIGEVAIGELVADTARVLERLGPTIVVGSSLGGLVAAFTAAAKPELVRALALLAPAFGFLSRLDSHVDDQGRMWTSEGFSFPLSPRVAADARSLDERALPSRLPMPVLVVHGTADDTVPVRAGEAFFAAIPHRHKALWLVPGGDHRLNAFAAAIWPRFDALVAASAAHG